MPGHPLRRALGTWWRDRSVGFRRIVRTLVLLLASTLVCLGTAAVAVRGCTSVGVVRVVGVSGGIIPL